MSLYEDFVERINANPKDMDTRLIYADWLEDVDPALAEAWRVITEMNRVPALWQGRVSSLFEGWNWFTSLIRTGDIPTDCYPYHWRETTAEGADDMGICRPLYPSYPTAFEALTAYAEVWITAKELDLLDPTITFRFTADERTKVSVTNHVETDLREGPYTLRRVGIGEFRDIEYTGLIYEPPDMPKLIKAVQGQDQVRMVIKISDDLNTVVSNNVVIRSIQQHPANRLDVRITAP